MNLVTLDDIRTASERIKGRAHRTPVLTSRTFNERVNADVFFKAECFQRTGSFKFRGATNAMSQIADQVRQSGVVTYSSGNHAQALACAGRDFGVPVTVVMPNDAPMLKREATAGYGAEVVLYDIAEENRVAKAKEIAEERGAPIIPPFDHPHIIAGAGTAMLELWEDAGPFDTVLICVGGGGLLSGCAAAAKALHSGIEVIGVEPTAGDDGGQSFRTGVLTQIPVPTTIADGARTTSLSALTFAHMQAHVDEMTDVSDADLLEMTEFFWTRMKAMVEPTGSLAGAALLSKKIQRPGKRIGVLISGGNCDPVAVAGWMRDQKARTDV